MRPGEHEELALIANSLPGENERALGVGEGVILRNRRGVDLGMLVEEILVAGIAELHQTEDAREGAVGLDGA